MQGYPTSPGRRFLPARGLQASGALVLTALLPACGPAPSMTRGLERTDRYVAAQAPDPDASESRPPARPLATVDGAALTIDMLRPALLEAAGPAVLEEAMIDLLAAREASRRGVTVTQEMVDRERDLLLDSFVDAGAAPDRAQAGQILSRQRDARGLGPSRYASLLRRNATLRALVQDEVSVTQEALDQEFAFRFGPRYRARLISVPSAPAATDALERLNAGEEFSALAARVSTDASAVRGGVLEPVSPADASYPSGVRTALRAMQPGQVSDPIQHEGAFLILKLDEIIPADAAAPDMQAARPQIERQVRIRQERLLMDRLARRLVEAAPLVIFDRSLENAWAAEERAR
ncbi:MAG: peptidylprolyl isomerase [Planctomycetota bacterium]|nr:peptidylprolyl isomerase [Planctomycetota bacterium]